MTYYSFILILQILKLFADNPFPIALLKQKNNVFITATAAAGACGATPAIALLLAHANIHWLGAFNTGLKSPPQFVWPQAVVAGGLFLLGLLVQCRLAAHDKKVKARNTDAMRNAQVRYGIASQ